MWNTIRSKVVEAIASLVLAVIVIPNWQLAQQWVTEKKSEQGGLILLLVLLGTTWLSLLFVVKIIKEKLSSPKFDRNLYWKPWSSNPLCPVCKSKEEKLSHMQKTEFSGKVGYRCHACRHQHIEGDNGDFYTQAF